MNRLNARDCWAWCVDGCWKPSFPIGGFWLVDAYPGGQPKGRGLREGSSTIGNPNIVSFSLAICCPWRIADNRAVNRQPNTRAKSPAKIWKNSDYDAYISCHEIGTQSLVLEPIPTGNWLWRDFCWREQNNACNNDVDLVKCENGVTQPWMGSSRSSIKLKPFNRNVTFPEVRSFIRN